MSFDLDIFCIMEKKGGDISFPFPSKFYFTTSKVRFPRASAYASPPWAYSYTCVGYWHSLLPTDERYPDLPGYVGCQDVCKAHCTQQCIDDFKIWKNIPEGEDYPIFNSLYEEWMYHKNICLETLEIKQEYREDFERIIDYFLERSPAKMIIFLPRLQGNGRDNVEGVLKRDLFFEMLDTGKIKFNTCYIIIGQVSPTGRTVFLRKLGR